MLLVDDEVIAVTVAHELAGHGAHEERGNGVLEHEVGLVLLARDDEVRHTQGQSRIGSGLHRDELVGITGGAIE
mgnify:CR=1 FL=1